jgi:hypothetical protein
LAKSPEVFAGKNMQKGLKIDGQMRALAIALAGAIVTSVIAMLIPVGVFEAITGSTGISELIPATAAPLGDTARALIAFGFGATAFAAIAAILFRRSAGAVPVKPSAPKAEPADHSEESGFVERMKSRIAEFAEGRRSDNVVTELSDLPKLRPGDAHPDAPPRRPISAHRDFAEIAPEPVPVAPEPPVVAPPESVAAPEHDAGSVTHMVDRLEAAVSEREAQLEKLEALAKVEIAKPAVQPEAPVAEPVVAEIVEPAPRQTILEAVPSEPAKQSGADEMDAALRSALETLHRMNARTR